jgi:hypothetical protein
MEMHMLKAYSVFVLLCTMTSAGDTGEQMQAQPRGAAVSTQMTFIAMPADHRPGDWDWVDEIWQKANRVTVPKERREQVFEQVFPWFKRVLAEDFVPHNVPDVGLEVMEIDRLGDVYLINFAVQHYRVRIVDTPMSITATFRSDSIRMGTPRSVLEDWQKWIRVFMRDAKRFDSPGKAGCWSTPKELYFSPAYDGRSKLGCGVEFWWDSSSYKFGEREFRLSVWKRFDGEHHDSDYENASRYQNKRQSSPPKRKGVTH